MNHVKFIPLNARMFKLRCEEILRKGKNVSTFKSDRTASFQSKLEFWKMCLKRRQDEYFPTLTVFLLETESILEETISGTGVQHLKPSLQAFQKHFPEILIIFYRNPYCDSEKPEGMSVQNYEYLIDDTRDISLKQLFNKLPLVKFWCIVLQECLKNEAFDNAHLSDKEYKCYLELIFVLALMSSSLSSVKS